MKDRAVWLISGGPMQQSVAKKDDVHQKNYLHGKLYDLPNGIFICTVTNSSVIYPFNFKMRIEMNGVCHKNRCF